MSSDQITFAILTNAIRAIADEMGAILVRSAFSTIVREARDCSTALLDAEGNVVVQAEMIPIHNGGLSQAFQAAARQLDLSCIGEGQAILLNDPYAGGQHLNDLILFQPILSDGELLGWAGNTAHHLDIGGGGAGINIDAGELISEGIVIPPLLIDVERDLFDGPVDRMLFANIRTAELGRGDLYAQLAANRIGMSRMRELAVRYGATLLRQAMRETLSYSERRMQAALDTIPDGSWEGSGQVDSDVRGGEPLVVKVKVTVASGRMTLDFAGTCPQVNSMFNSSRSSSLAAIVSAVRSVLADKDIPANDGLMNLLDIRLPQGSILNPDPGKPVRARIEASYRAADAVYAALAQAIPERVPSDGFNSTTGLYLTQTTTGGRVRIYGDVLGGGYGAGVNYDGAHALAGILSSSRNTPIEAIEQIHPHIRMRHYKLVQDSSGAGQWRGGLGFSRAIEVLEDGVTLSFYSDHFRFAPRGRNGGMEGGMGSLKVHRGNELLEFPATAVVPLKKGDVVELSVGGGAGWGDPSARRPEAIEDDLADGIISSEFARRHYPNSTR